MNKSIWLVILAGFVALLIGCHAGGNAPFVNVPSESDIVSFEREVDKNGRFDDITFPSGAVIKCTQDDTLKKGTKINATEQKIPDGNPAYIYNITAKLITNDALNTSVSVNTLEKPISVTLPNNSTTGTCYIGTRASDSDPWRYSLVTDSLADIRFARLQASTPSQCNFNLYRLDINFAIFVLNNQSKEEAEVDSVEITPTEDVEYKDEKYISDLNIKVKVSGEKLDGIKTDNLKARIVYRSDSLNPEQLKANGSIVKQTDSDDNAVSGTYEHTFEVSNINIESQMSGEAVVSFVLNLAGVNLQAFPTTFLVEFYSDGKAENTLPFIYTQAFSFETKEQRPEPEPLVTYTITYDLDGGEPTGNNPSEYTVESEFTLSNPTKTGYTFLGWTGTDLDKATTQVTIDKGSTGERTYTAHFVENYNIIYDLADGSLPQGTTNPATYSVISDDITLNNPTQEGYTFKGWSGTGLTGDNNMTVSVPQGSIGDKNFKANYTPTNYGIIYQNIDGATFATANPTNYTVETDTITLNNPTKEGYTFTGWSGTDLTGDTNKEVNIVKGSTGERTYTANFTPIDYEISYLNVDGATFATVNPSTYNIETETFTLNNPTKDDYTFAGWSGTDLTGDTNKEVKITKGSTGERTYTAHFVENYNITYDLADGSLPQGTTNPATYSVLSDTITLNNPTRKNYVFLGWTGTGIEEGTASETVKIYQGTTGARSYVASWTLADVLVFNLDDSNTVTLEMRKCPAGTFIMGSPNNELGRSLPYADYDETQHSVTISKDFWMGTYEVTQAQYRAIMGDNPSFNTSDSETVLPVERILWIDLMTPSTGFMDIINEKLKNQLPEGYKFDLPTDAQWEYACRAGTETSLNNGTSIVNTGSEVEDTYLNAVGWYYYNWGNENQKSHSIGKLAPNSFGLYDMHGNVSEWVKDWYGDSYYQYCIDNNITIDPQGPETGSSRVTRGGDLSYNPAYCRSAARNPLSPDGYRSKCNGFRLALVKE
ncbi:MAG: SUMF1/EgtB/PvdO family nonheme iron enzyme [Candidatus Riflebacteria bacterium]|nr:SUMF1/EgtB/PvdO family nonheme iron enzyme [Candidatus Riflebacteria bacterium]